MITALVAVPAATDGSTVPLVLTVVMATAALVGIAITVRHLRRTDRLTPVNMVASGVSAAGILASALLLSVALGTATAASASNGTVPAPPAATTPSDLTGLQLPTE
jgi:lipopolysaccharide export LptBFGC system permease protein LptF